MSSWWTRTVGGLPDTFWYLWTGTLINRLGNFSSIYLGVYLLTVRNFEPAYVGLVMGLGGLGSAVGVLIGGIVADRWGRRYAMLGPAVPTAAAMVALGLTQDRIGIPVLVALIGCLVGTARPAYGATIVDLVGPANRTRALTLNYWAINLGFSVAALLAGLLIGVDPRLLFAVNAAAILATAALIAAKVPESRPEVVPTDRPSSGVGFGFVFRDRVFMGFVGLTILFWTMIESVDFLPLALRADGHPNSSYGRVLVVNSVMIVVAQLFVPALVARFPRARVLALSSLLIGLGFGLVTFAGPLWSYAGTVAIWTLGEMIMVPANAALIAELSPVDARARYQGMNQFSFTSATFIGPIVGGLVVQHLGASAWWLGICALGVVGALANLLVGPSRVRRAAQLLEQSVTPAPVTVAA